MIPKDNKLKMFNLSLLLISKLLNEFLFGLLEFFQKTRTDELLGLKKMYSIRYWSILVC